MSSSALGHHFFGEVYQRILTKQGEGGMNKNIMKKKVDEAIGALQYWEN